MKKKKSEKYFLNESSENKFHNQHSMIVSSLSFSTDFTFNPVPLSPCFYHPLPPAPWFDRLCLNYMKYFWNNIFHLLNKYKKKNHLFYVRIFFFCTKPTPSIIFLIFLFNPFWLAKSKLILPLFYIS